MAPTEVAANFGALAARAAHASGDLDAASKRGHEAARLAPGDAAVHFSLGLIQIDSGLDDIGIQTLEAAARTAGDAGTWYALGVAALQTGQHFKSFQHLQKAAEIDPAYAEPVVMLAQLTLARLETTPQDQIPVVVAEAAGHLDKAAARNPDVPGLRTLRAQLAVVAGKLEEAERLVREEVKLHPAEDGGWLALAQLLLQTERNQAAREELETAAKREDTGPDVLVLLADLEVQEQRLALAIPPLERALALVPASDQLRPKLAQVHHLLGRTDEARRLLEEHLARFDATEARLLLAQLEIDAQHYEAAEAALAKAEARGDMPNEVAILRYFAALRSGAAKDQAKAKAIATLGTRSELAQVLLTHGIWEEAEALLREALREDVQDEQAPVMLYAMLLSKGRGEDAEKLAKDVIATTPEASREEAKRRFEQAREEAQALLKSLESQRPAP
jgi:tetratricopeptide (TPR) repeat protein